MYSPYEDGTTHHRNREDKHCENGVDWGIEKVKPSLEWKSIQGSGGINMVSHQGGKNGLLGLERWTGIKRKKGIVKDGRFRGLLNTQITDGVTYYSRNSRFII